MIEINRSGWKRVRFGDVVESITNRVDDPARAGVDRYVGLEHLDPHSLTINRWGSPADVGATKLRFEPGDVVFARRRAYQRKLGRAGFGGIASAHSLVLRARSGRMLPEFLPVFLGSDAFMDRAIQISVGSLSPTVNWKTLAVQEFLLPPLDEQHRISELLWSIDRARAAARSRIRAAESALTIHCTALCGLLDDSGTPLDSLASRSIGGVWGADAGSSELDVTVLRSTEFADWGWPEIGETPIRSISKAQYTSRELHSGDILLEKSGGTDTRPVGRVVRLSLNHLHGPTVGANFLQLIRADEAKVEPSFFFWLLWGMHAGGTALSYQQASTNIRNLRTGDYLGQRVQLPSRTDQQGIGGLADGLQTALAVDHRLVRETSQLMQKVGSSILGNGALA